MARKNVKSVYLLGIFLLLTLQRGLAAGKEASDEIPVNKLLYMYDIYYLPFSVEFKVGRSPNDILPYIADKQADGLRLLKTEELKKLDTEWTAIKTPYADKSLLQKTPVTLNQSVRITDHLASHHLALSRTPFEHLSLEQRIQISKSLAGRSPEVQAVFKQLTFLKSLMREQDYDKYNLFIFSASWCESCREYRILLESYLKTFPKPVVLHSVFLEDPKEEIFENPLVKELFPHAKRYSHESIPMFMGLEFKGSVAHITEEGEALEEFYNRFLKEHRGFLDNRSTLFKKGARGISSVSAPEDL